MACFRLTLLSFPLSILFLGISATAEDTAPIPAAENSVSLDTGLASPVAMSPTDRGLTPVSPTDSTVPVTSLDAGVSETKEVSIIPQAQASPQAETVEQHLQPLDKAIRVLTAGIVAMVEESTSLTVLDLRDPGENITFLGKHISDRLSIALANTGKINVIERSVINKIIDEQKFQQTGLFDPRTVITIGKLAGVKYIVYGTTTLISDMISVDLKIIEIENARVIGGTSYQLPLTPGLAEMIKSHVEEKKITDAAPPPKPALPVQPVPTQSAPPAQQSQPVMISKKKIKIPAGTLIYAALREEVSSKTANKGEIVNGKVWKDLIIDGQTVIERGTPVTFKVSDVHRASMVGIKGSVKMRAVSLSLDDGREVILEGGYNEVGKSNMAVSIVTSALLAWPLIFIYGKQAILEEGAMIDVYTANTEYVDIGNLAEEQSAPTLTLKSRSANFSVNILMEQMLSAKDPKELPMAIQMNDGVARPNPPEFFIDKVNGAEIGKRIPCAVTKTETKEGHVEYVVQAELKSLVEKFRRGLNRFDVCCIDGGQRQSYEVILNMQF